MRKRSHRVVFYLDDEEFSAFIEKVKRTSLSREGFIRNMLADVVIKERPPADVPYLLTTKLFCGKCQCLMVGESGTSRTKIVHRYYKCVSVKNHKGCDKKTVKKDWIEAAKDLGAGSILILFKIIIPL